MDGQSSLERVPSIRFREEGILKDGKITHKEKMKLNLNHDYLEVINNPKIVVNLLILVNFY